MHHDYDFAVNRNGLQNIFLNTPNQAAWFERYITDSTGPKGRLGRMQFTMKKSVFPGDEMHIDGDRRRGRDRRDRLRVGDAPADALGRRRHEDQCTARVALPTSADDNPWTRRGDQWRPRGDE